MYRFLYFFLLFPVLGFAQYAYKEEKIVFPDEVVSSMVFATLKKDHFLYIATQKGLYLHDGYTFVKSKNVNKGIQNFFADNQHIYLEEEGVGLVAIQNIFLEKKIIQKVVYTDANEDNDHYENIYKDSYGNIWSSDFHHVKFIAPHKNQPQSFLISKNNKTLEIDVNYIPTKNGLLITSDFGIFLWNRNPSQPFMKVNAEKITSSVFYNGKVYTTKNSSDICGFSIAEKTFTKPLFHIENNRFVQNITDGTPLIGYNNASVYELDFANGTKRSILASEEKINHVFYDQEQGIFWVSTQNGLIKLIREKGIIKNVALPAAHSTITSILETEEGALWYTDTQGNVIHKKGNNTQTFQIGEKTYQMSFSEGYLLIGAERGIYLLNPKSPSPSFQKIISTPQKIKKALIQNGKIWALPEIGKISVFDIKTYKEIPNFIKNDQQFFEDVLFNDIVNNQGKIWIASWMPKDYGITYFDEKTQLLKQISIPKAPNPEFIGDYYNRVQLLKNGNLIFSAYGGWNIVSNEGKILKRLDINSYENVANGNIQGVAEDDANNLWFGCAEGLYRYHTSKNTMLRISRKDGMASNNLVFGFWMGSKNQLYFATEKAVQQIDINALYKVKLFDELKITAIKINNEFIGDIPKKLEFAEEVTQHIDIFFSVLNFWGKDKIKYRYRFGNEKWEELGEEPKLSLVKLSTGNYNITIEASDNLEEAHKKYLNFELSIVPPFYKTVWFYTLLALCTFALALYINHYLVLKEKKEGMLIKKIKENENRMLRSQMNPHFLFNSLNSINSFIIQNKGEEASVYLTSFSKLMRKILDNSRKNAITLKEELEATKLYLDLEAVRLEHKFDYSIVIDKKINEEEIMIPALILQPFLENSIWHGINQKPNNGFISITIGIKNNSQKIPYLNIKIQDDGIGREAAKKKKKEPLHKSHGLDITLERLQMSDARNKAEIIDLYDENHMPTGTLVNLNIFYYHD